MSSAKDQRLNGRVVQKNMERDPEIIVSHSDNSDSTGNRVAPKADRVDYVTGRRQPNRGVDKAEASRLADLLEGIRYPATKDEIRKNIKSKPSPDSETREIMDAIEKNLDGDATFASTYHVELAAGLVKSSDNEKPYVRDRALNRANGRRIGEKIRVDPYGNYEESVGIASKEDVSPNTPRGESV